MVRLSCDGTTASWPAGPATPCREDNGEETDSQPAMANVGNISYPRMPRVGEYAGVDEDEASKEETCVVSECVTYASRTTPDELAECEQAFAMVARSVSRKEVRGIPEANEA